MTKQLKISDELYEMLCLLKPFPSTSFNDLILLMIDEIAPYLSREIATLKKLEEEDPEKAISERKNLQKEVFETTIIDLLSNKRDRDEERAIDEYLAKKEKEGDN
jgi:predicted CopG family antitoxin